MRQFFDAYKDDEKVSALLTQLPWTHHLMILGQCKHPEEREFYIRLTVQEKWASRELERQLKACLFERAVINPPKMKSVIPSPGSGKETVGILARSEEQDFAEVVSMIQQARQRSLTAVNIRTLHWNTVVRQQG
jgi:hypothetical protein